ncbi:MAG TPA: hypothetical protein VG294_09975 [Solirubrobacteraceae bacterium]|nr:hypothetical protein [Solirubrobacteraceae bacterium]
MSHDILGASYTDVDSSGRNRTTPQPLENLAAYHIWALQKVLSQHWIADS